MPNVPIVWFATVLIVACVFLALLHRYLTREVWDAEGKNAVKQTRRILKRYAALRRFKVLKNLCFETDRGSVEVETMLVGFFGILLVHTCGARGEYYCDSTGSKWTIVSGSARKSFENPLNQQQKAIVAMREIFAQNKVYKISMDKTVYISSSSKKTAVFIPSSNEVALPGRLRAYMDKEKFDVDNNVDVEQLVAILEQYQQNK